MNRVSIVGGHVLDSAQMTRSEILARFPGASQSLLNLADDFNLHAPDPKLRARRERPAVQAASVRSELERNPRDGALGAGEAQGADSKRFLVRVTSIRRRLLDEDNLCEKFVVDCCRYAGLLYSDAPGQTSIETRQRKAGKDEPEATLIEIFELPTNNL